MGLQSGRAGTSNNIQTNGSSKTQQPTYGIVFEIITDADSETGKDKGAPGAAAIGAIRFRALGSSTANVSSNSELSLAYPLDKNTLTIPTRNEIVIIHNFGGNPHYSRMGGELSPNFSAISNLISSTFIPKPGSSSSPKSAKKYNNVSTTGIERTDSNPGKSEFDGYGDYFIRNEDIHKLKLYEGDTLLESRFGQSIRFSGYNNSENKFAPTITIRNGENPNSLQSGIGASTEENINTDGNIIFLGSGEKLLEWTLPTKNKKESFFDYPNELKGNQILLSSDRIILSAKTSQMIFSSKGDTGFITDGQFSIDTTKGINVTSNEAIYFDVTNDFDFYITCSGGGAISLGSTIEDELEPAAKGETLVGLLGEMLDLITQQIYVTPAGPTSPGPTNIAQFASLKAKLNSILSNTVQLK